MNRINCFSGCPGLIRKSENFVSPRMIPNIGPLEIAIVLIIALVVFGPKRLPELGRSAGKGFREFKGSLTGDQPEPDEPAAPAIEKSTTRG